MNVRKVVAMAVMAALFGGIVPLTALAGDDTVATPGIRASIPGAVAKSLTDNHQPAASTRPAAKRAAAGQAVSGGGGGKVMAIVTVISTIGGLAATYFVVKQMRKQTGQ